MAEAARNLDYTDDYIYGSAAPARGGYAEPVYEPAEEPAAEERIRQREREAAVPASQTAPTVSLFAVFGAVFAGFLMVFVVLAQISYNEIASETVALKAQYTALLEQQRRLEINFESVVDMKEVEQYARDVLGMSRPESDQITIVYSMPADKVEVLATDDGADPLREFGSFISSLLEYFKRD